MAAALMRQRIASLGLSDQVQVLSAGVWAEPGFEASVGSVAVMGQRGLDLTTHRSQPVTPELLDRADIVLVMEEAHRRSLFYLSPRHLGKVFLLTEMAGQHEDVADPYGGPVEGYEQTATLLENLLDRGLPTILRRLGIQVQPAAPRVPPLPKAGQEDR